MGVSSYVIRNWENGSLFNLGVSSSRVDLSKPIFLWIAEHVWNYIYYIALINYSNIKNCVFYWLGHYFLVTWLIWKALLDWEISILSYTQITRIFRKGMLSIAGRNPAEDHPWWKSDRNQPNEWHYCLSTSDLIS